MKSQLSCCFLPTAILLLGPTGAGKTPLGDYLEKNGLAGRRCHHFDFGDHLRRIDSDRLSMNQLTIKDRTEIRRVLRGGQLLKDCHFYIAAAILENFIRRHKTGSDDIIVLNGLPRHAGQAEKIGSIVRVERVVALRCSPAVVWDRIKENAGGDRKGRVDDSRAEVVHKLNLYRKATAPIERYYRRRGVPVTAIRITIATTPGEIAKRIKKSLE